MSFTNCHELSHPGANPSLIDHFITNRRDLVSDIRVTPCNISDHDLIAACLSVTKTRYAAKTISVRSTRRVDIDAMCLDLLHADWSSIQAPNCTKDKWNSFYSTWEPIMNRHMPVRTVTLKHRPYTWLWDERVQEEMVARDRARIDRERTPCDATDREFRERRNAVKVALNRACSSYFHTSFRHSRTKTWRDIRQFLVAPGRVVGGVGEVDRGPAWTDRLNRFFSSVGPDVARSLAATDTGEALPPRRRVSVVVRLCRSLPLFPSCQPSWGA